MRRILAVLVLAAAAMIGVAKPSHAAITFEYRNTCVANCALLGLNPGDAVSATISFDDAAIIPSGIVSQANVLDFTLDFGTVDITFASAAAFSFTGLLDATASAFDIVILQASEAIVPDLGDTVQIGSTIAFFAGPQGACANVLCAPNPSLLDAAIGGPAAFVRVPEPASLALFGTALVGLALARRRRKAA